MNRDDNPLPELGNRSPQGRRNARNLLRNCVFVSHSGRDWPFIKEHVERVLSEALSVATYTPKDGTWDYTYGIFCFSYAKLGDAYASTVSIALGECRAFVVVVSRSAMQSDWVRKELLYAQKRFRQILAISVDGHPSKTASLPWGSQKSFDSATRLRPSASRAEFLTRLQTFWRSRPVTFAPNTNRSSG